MSELERRHPRSRTSPVVRVSVVVPCFNEEAVIELTHQRLVASLGTVPSIELELVYIDDGSRDGTVAKLLPLARADQRVKIATFTRNFGHQAAVTAGMMQATGDVVAIMDADLQDPPEVILTMLERWREGYDVIYGIRTKRKEGLLKRSAYAIFYRFYRALSDIDVPLDSGDFALIDRAVLDVINALPERNRFLRGLRSWVGFRQTGVVYQRAARAAGAPKYNLRRLIRLAVDGILNFSTAPLNFIFLAGVASAALAAFALTFLVVHRLFGFKVFGHAPQDVPGFTSVAFGLLFSGGVQLMSIGILGAYIARIYQEVKGRPTYIIDRMVGVSAAAATRPEKTGSPHVEAAGAKDRD